VRLDLWTLACTAVVSGCQSATPEIPKVTYATDLRPIVEQSCVGCHYEGGIGPFPLETYEDLYAVRELARAAVESRTMPPWKATDGCSDYRYDWSLDDEEIALFGAWIDGGSLEGEGDGTPETEAPTERGLDRVDVTIAMPEAYEPAAAPDDYRCFLMPWPLTEGAFITGFQVVPGDATIVHHVIAYRVEPGEVDAYQKLDDDDPGTGNDCFGGPGGDPLTTNLLGGWAPGGLPGELPNGTGIYVEPGTWISLQLHYNLVSDEVGKVDDVTRVEFKVDDEVEKPAKIVFIADPAWVVAATMDIPAGEALVEHSFDYTVSNPFVIHTSNLHMHLLGQTARYSILRSDGTEDCMLDIDDWDFNWQMSYVFEEPKTFDAGDTLHLECTWDNSAANQPTVDGVQGAPHDVNWGEGTGDEMCLATMLVSY
jgi:hypothetical protein